MIAPIVACICANAFRMIEEEEQHARQSRWSTRLREEEKQRNKVKMEQRIRQCEADELELQKTAVDLIREQWDDAIRDGYSVYIHGIEIDSSNINPMDYDIKYDYEIRRIDLLEK